MIQDQGWIRNEQKQYKDVCFEKGMGIVIYVDGC